MKRDEIIDDAKTWSWSVVLGLAALYFLWSRGNYGILDAFELAVHETGHVLFAFFGEFIRMAGGTLLQLIVPIMLAWGFYKGDYRPGVQFSLFLLGHSLLNVSVYAQDARRQLLPLIGGRHVRLDWNWMLDTAGMLAWDQEIGYFYLFLAIVVFLFMAWLPRTMY